MHVTVQVDAAFPPRLARFDLAELDRCADTVFAVSESLELAYHNAGWDRFARDNGAVWAPGAWSIGASIADAIPGVLRPFYDELFRRAAADGEPVDHDYECSSPDTIRKMRMRVYPLTARGWLVVSSLVAELPPPPAEAPFVERYRDGHGSIVLCAHCRRARCATSAAGERWDWVPAWVTEPPLGASHGLCAPCLDHHYPRGGPPG